MDLRSLHYFSVVAEELNITRAAERLNMSQPPLSSQIKGLEEELGVLLFIRGKRHLTMTEAGALLYRRARQLLELSEQTQQEIRSLDGLSGDLNISLVEGRAPYLLARWIAGFRSEFPLVTFRSRRSSRARGPRGRKRGSPPSPGSASRSLRSSPPDRDSAFQRCPGTAGSPS